MLMARWRPPTSRTSPTPGARSSWTLTVLSAISVNSRRLRLAGEGEGEDRRLVVVELGDDRRLDVARQIPDRGGHPVAHVLGRDFDVATEVERDDHELAGPDIERSSLMPSMVLTASSMGWVTCDLDLLERRRAAGADADRGQVHRREAIHAEAEIARRSHDHQRQDDHRREDRPADTDLGKLLHYFLHRHGWPPVRLPGRDDHRARRA